MNKPLRVLIVEDSEDDARIIERELRRGGFDPTPRRVETLADLGLALARQEWDLIISDHSLPGFGSLEALELTRARQLDIPFIVVSGAIGEEMAVRAMKAGASDYIMKGSLARLVPSIERELREAWNRCGRRRAEQALRRSELELNDFFEHAPVGLCWVSADGTILRVNQAELDLLGYTHDEYAGRRIHAFHEDQAVAEQFLQRLHAGEAVHDLEASLRGRHGAVKRVLITANVLRENGRFVHARCFTRDITDREAGERARDYLAAIVESSDDAIIGTAVDGTIQSWNAGAERMYGYQAGEVVGSSVGMLVPDARAAEWREAYTRNQPGEKIGRLETVRRRKDGTTVEVAQTLSPIKNRLKGVVGISMIEHDITARRREEEERGKLITELTKALGEIKTLHGLLPVCSACKMIRDDAGEWKPLERYLAEHTKAEFTHGICPECAARLYPEYNLGVASASQGEPPDCARGRPWKHKASAPAGS